MNKFHVVLTNGPERDIVAEMMLIHDGALQFLTGKQLVVTYAPTTWVYAEVERKDDHGYPDAGQSAPSRPGGPSPRS